MHAEAKALIRDGAIPAPEGPGLGVSFDTDTTEEYVAPDEELFEP